jgi:hypothetical protein
MILTNEFSELINDFKIVFKFSANIHHKNDLGRKKGNFFKELINNFD